MNKLRSVELTPGMVLGKDLFNSRGDTLLSRNVTLTQDFIDRIVARGFHSVYVQDGVADNLERPEMVTANIRRLSCKHLGHLFDITQTTAEALAQDKVGREQLLEEFAVEVRPHFEKLYQDVDRFVGEVAQTQVLSGIVSLKSHDNYTFEHSIEVAVVSTVIGKVLRLSNWEIAQIALGCLCHDIGKIIVSTAILHKPAKLSFEEFEQMKLHPQTGYEVVRRLTDQRDIVARNLVRQHHERQDGKGYPQRLHGTNRIGGPDVRFGRGLILLAAEIASVADVYSAVASDRPYRAAMAPPQVVSTLMSLAGPALNLEITKRFLGMIPSFPVGTEVTVVSGRLTGYMGIVSSIRPSSLNRPTVRVLFGPNMRNLSPFEVDTSKERELELSASPLPPHRN